MILNTYPSELLEQIFLYLLADDVKHLEEVAFLHPFYLQSKYRIMKLDSQKYPSMHSLSLTLFMDRNPWFVPKTLQSVNPLVLQLIPEEYLSRFENIDLERVINLGEYSQISHLKNIRKLQLAMTGPELQLPTFQKNLKTLNLRYHRGETTFPDVRELGYFGSLRFDKLPPNLVKLDLWGVNQLDFKLKLPQTLLHMKLDYMRGIARTFLGDILYLDLESLEINFSINLLKVPTTLTSLICGEHPIFSAAEPQATDLSDLRFLENLKKVEIRSGQFILPESVKSLQYLDYAAAKFLDSHDFPEDITSLKLYTLELVYAELSPEFKLPSNLEVFSLGDLNGTGHGINMKWPESLKEIHIGRRLESDGTYISGVLPAGLRTLSLNNVGKVVSNPTSDPGLFEIGTSLTKLSISNCSLPDYLQLPQTLWELKITDCQLTAEKWNTFAYPERLIDLDLLDNDLDLFVVPLGLNRLQLFSNRVDPSIVPHWELICELYPVARQGWIFVAYTKHDQLEEYNVEYVGYGGLRHDVRLMKATIVITQGGVQIFGTQMVSVLIDGDDVW